MELYGGTLTGVDNQAHGTYAPDYGSVLVTLTTTSDNAEIMLLFGGHIAAGLGPRGWGAGLGAGGISGGNYHIRITEVDGTSIGNRDNQLMSGAITLNDTTITTSAQSSGTAGGTIIDTATLAGTTADATGTITFTLYGPVATNTPTCTPPAVFTSTVPVQPGVLTYDSAPFTVTGPGFYFWVASYSGDVGNNPSAGRCGSANEVSHVVKATPGISTTATTPVPIGAAISDTADLSGLVGTPTAGQVTFQVYGDSACSTPLTPAPLVATAVSPSGTDWLFTSPAYTPTTPGSYYWRAFYAGNGQNAAVAGACQAAGETSVVTPRQPTIATQATASAPVGTAITDSATISGVYGPLTAGQITFTLYSDSQCSVPVPPATIAGDPATLTNTGSTWSVTSMPVTPTAAGTYFWRAFYAGNGNNLPASGACGDANEASTLTRHSPAIATSATPTVVIGSPISDTATLTGLFGALAPGQVTFALYSDATCTSRVGGSIAAASVSQSGTTWTIVSVPVTPGVVGTYYWRAFYAGDGDNDPISGACDATAEHSDVTKSQPGLTTQATEVAPLLTALLHDSAHLTGVYGPVTTAEVTFRVYATDTCATALATLPALSAAQQPDGSWVVVSADWSPPGAGTYYWRAFYAGNASNLAVSGGCNALNEHSMVNPATPAISTTATASVPVGGSITDVAHLTGYFGTPTSAAVTFTVYSDANCTSVLTTVAGASVSAAGPNAWDVTSAAVPVDVAGTYRWIASLTADPNNTAVSGRCGDAGETSVLTKLSPTIATSARPTVAVGGTATDTALLSGVSGTVAVAASQVTFTVYSDAGCGTVLGTVAGATATLAGGVWSVVSQPFTTTHAGTLFWRASYAGDVNDNPVAGGCSDAGEQTAVTPLTPLISTATEPAALVGDAVTDTAFLSGVFGPVLAGDVTFVLYSDAGCTTVAGTVSGIRVTGGNGSWVVTSAAMTPPHAGPYHWVATYAGNGDNVSVRGACSDVNETVTLAPRLPSLATVATSSAPVGSVIHDVATITGVFGPLTAGQVHFALYTGADCTGPATSVATVSGTQSGDTWTATSADYPTPVAGAYHWIASYDGNVDNAPIAGTCGDSGENTSVTRLAPAISTTATPTVEVGATIVDTATLTGVFAGTTVLAGQVHFALYDDADCTHLVATLGTVNLVNGATGWVATSAGFPTPAVGAYRWIASYAGDANNAPVAGTCGDTGETSAVTARAPAITTDAQTPVAVGSTITDTATLTGIFGAIVPADVVFTVYDNASCSGAGTVVAGSTLVAHTGESWTIRSAPFTTLHAGAYHWVAAYAGNANNGPVSGACADSGEASTVTQAQPRIDTSAVDSVTVGAAISDVANLHGVFGPVSTADVTFELYLGADCPGVLIATVPAASATLVGGVWVVTSAVHLAAAAGTYHWIARYAGNADNGPAAGVCGDDGETSTVDQAQPNIDTSADAGATVGAAIHDIARLTGLAPNTTVTPTSVTFQLYSDAACTSLVTSVPGAFVDAGAGQVFVSSAGVMTAAAGHYWWIATYAGDANNKPAAGACGDAGENTVVDKQAPAITTTATAQTGLGSSISDTATLAGLFGSAPGGSVTFTAYATADCTGEPVFVAADRPLVAGTAGAWTVDSGSFTPAVAGTYRWIASYSGDANNLPVAGLCGDVGETSAVGDLLVVKSVDKTVASYGDQIDYTLTGTAYSVDQHAVVITDVVPAGTTYLFAGCPPPCTSSYLPATRTVTWTVGTLAAGASVAVLFAVHIDVPAPGPDGKFPGILIDNIGAIGSAETPKVPSNPVQTKVHPSEIGTAVSSSPPPLAPPQPAPNQPGLAVTGAGWLAPALWLALVMLAAGTVLSVSGRRRRPGAR
ncbi:MAG: DUF11 domain-containing protein [Actinomycetota bacterium]|nr:DUF11 domain-containing protein [Actinomycetota bacterium]